MKRNLGQKKISYCLKWLSLLSETLEENSDVIIRNCCHWYLQERNLLSNTIMKFSKRQQLKTFVPLWTDIPLTIGAPSVRKKSECVISKPKVYLEEFWIFHIITYNLQGSPCDGYNHTGMWHYRHLRQ